MTPIYIGHNPNPGAIFKGDKEIDRVWKGNALVWEKPRGNFKIEVDTNVITGTEVILYYTTSGMTINWGDGNTTTVSGGTSSTHEYAEEGVYTITMTGWVSRFGLDTWSINYRATAITKVLEWNDLLGLESLHLNRNTNLVSVPDHLPKTVTNLFRGFAYCESFNDPNVSEWDVSNVTNMERLFLRCFLFDQPLNDWDVSNVDNMSWLFYYAHSFNQDLDDWDVSNVDNMSYMFLMQSGQGSFNKNINDWDVSNVDNMRNMFEGGVFNQPLNGWDTSNVTVMDRMFYRSQAFNQDLNNWDVGKVTTFSEMFRGNPVFNGDLSGWNIGEHTGGSTINMNGMFRGTDSFNHPSICNWDVSEVTAMTAMFAYQTAMWLDLSGWCLPHIPEMPTTFAANNHAWLSKEEWHPQWGESCS